MEMNAVQYIVSKGFVVTSDPRTYASGVWGLRNYTVNGYNYDSYCNGYHRAYDFGSKNGDGAAIPSVCDGTVVSGTTSYGNFGAQVVILDSAGRYQHIYGHLKRNIPVSIGQKVKQGQTIGYQGATNYNNVYMASHLHYQVQTAGYRAEWAFVCDGINPLNVMVTGKASSGTNTNVVTYDIRWNWKGKIKTTAAINYRIYPHTSAKRESTIPVGTTLSFDKLYASDGYWWVRTNYKGGLWFVAVGKRNKKVGFLTDLDGGKLWAKSVGKINTSGGRHKGKKATHAIGDEMVSNNKPVSKSNTKTFNMYNNRGRSTTSYVRGTIDNLGADVRNRKGSQSTGFNWNQSAGVQLRPGETVHIFEVHNGWGRIFTGNLTGQGSNRWIWLGRLNVNKVYK